MPSKLITAKQKYEKEKERQRNSKAQKRKLEKEKRLKNHEPTQDQDVISGPPSRVIDSLIHPMFPDLVPHPPPQNAWLNLVIQKWDSYPISSIELLHSIGSIILKKLASLPNPLPGAPLNGTLIKMLGKPTRGSTVPTLRLVGNDLVDGSDHNVVEFITRNPEIGISGIDVMLSITNVLTMCDMNSPERRLYGALDIRLGEKGIKLCQYRATPYDNDKRFLVDPGHWTVALTPPAAITHTHADYYGRHQFFIHLFGHKLWLLWPPTKKNLDIYGKYHTQTTPVDLTSRCIDELEGLQAFFTTEEQAFVMMPNVLHACISVSASSHLGTWVWMLPEYKASLSMVGWGLEWLGGKAGTDAPISDYEEELTTIKSEIDVWKRLIKENPKDADSKEAKKILKSLEIKYSEVELLFK
jgi:hypothetical protein